MCKPKLWVIIIRDSLLTGMVSGRRGVCRCSSCSQNSCKKELSSDWLDFDRWTQANKNMWTDFFLLLFSDKCPLSPSTQFDCLLKPLLVHGLLHQLSLQSVVEGSTTDPLPVVKVSVLEIYNKKTRWLTISTHSMSGRRTAWLPDSPMTQAGVSGVASNRATTASTPNLVLWEKKNKKWFLDELNEGLWTEFFIIFSVWISCDQFWTASVQTHQNSVKRWGSSSSLNMAEDSQPSVVTKSLLHQL